MAMQEDLGIEAVGGTQALWENADRMGFTAEMGCEVV